MKIVFKIISTSLPLLLLPLLIAAPLAGCYQYPPAPTPPVDPTVDRAEVALGQRLFRDGRFSQRFFVESGGDVNAVLPAGEPVIATTPTLGLPLPGPYATGGMNCASCHLVDEQLGVLGGGMRAYAGFSRRAPVPAREDGRTETLRNVPTMVGVLLPRPGGVFLHFDGQFTTAQSLVVGTLESRDFGWLPGEGSAALAHVAKVIRGDDGQGEVAADGGHVPYRAAFLGAAWLPDSERIPPALRLDVMHASDAEVVGAVANLIAAYMGSLTFMHDAAGDFDGSAYDRFLRKNGLPLHPNAGETPIDYARRLRTLLEELAQPAWVGPGDGTLVFQDHPFQFGRTELDGLRIFLAEPSAPAPDGGVGECLGCHAPPTFTDFRFHNTGVSQLDYDAQHGAGSFAALAVPSLADRDAQPALYLPPSPTNPTAPGPFADIPSAAKPGHADLGLWNVFANPDLPEPQASLRDALCAQLGPPCTDDALLPRTLGMVKTPGLRDLGQSQPYMHDGAFDTVEDAVDHYVREAALARAGQVRNGDPLLAAIHLSSADAAALAAFLHSLDEDYH